MESANADFDGRFIEQATARLETETDTNICDRLRVAIHDIQKGDVTLEENLSIEDFLENDFPGFKS